MPVFVPVLDGIRVFIGRMIEPGIHDGQSIKACGHHRRLGQADWSGPVLADESDMLQVEGNDQARQHLCVPRDGVPVNVSGFVRLTKP